MRTTSSALMDFSPDFPRIDQRSARSARGRASGRPVACRHGLMEKLHPLCGQLQSHRSHSGDIAAWPGQIGDEACFTASSAMHMMMGIFLVACWAARTPGVLPMMTSTLSRTRSAASSGSRSGFSPVRGAWSASRAASTGSRSSASNAASAGSMIPARFPRNSLVIALCAIPNVFAEYARAVRWRHRGTTAFSRK